MARYLSQPTLYVDFLRPKKMRFDTPGAATDSGRNGLGESISMDTTGGGIVTGTYERCVIFGRDYGDDERHEYINMLGARLNGGFRFVNVPIVNDGIGPFPVIDGKRRPIITGIQHSDGSFFQDGSGYSQPTVWAKLTENAGLNAGQVKLRIYGASRDLRWSDWMSIYHNQNGDASKGWRAWRYWKNDKTDEGTEVVSGITMSFKDYTLGISPPLREATVAGTRIEVARPTCVMKFPVGFSLPFEYEANYEARPTLQFTEAF
jgi:hypothetical protein